jgi:hypothetical protein
MKTIFSAIAWLSAGAVVRSGAALAGLNHPIVVRTFAK